ncbi:MAG: hypothetical protein KatS3mg109_0035 [Pirellulaceae bacterium]|nr:MAG: hypothetical protein KatS3mg109_0035 [Pirellulaceae bacterium]
MRRGEPIKIEIVDNPNVAVELFKFAALGIAVAFLIGVIASSSTGVEAVGSVVEGISSGNEITIDFGMFTLLKWAIQLAIFSVVVGFALAIVFLALKSAGVLAWLGRQVFHAATGLAKQLGVRESVKSAVTASQKVGAAVAQKVVQPARSGPSLRDQVYGYAGEEPVTLGAMIDSLKGAYKKLAVEVDALRKDVAGPIASDIDELESSVSELKKQVDELNKAKRTTRRPAAGTTKRSIKKVSKED